MNGLRPVAEIQFADYIHPATNQIVNEAAKIRYRSNGDYGCPLVVRAPFGGGVHGGLYHSQSVEALFFHVPGLKIVIPVHALRRQGPAKAAIRDQDPVLFFEHKRSYRLHQGRGAGRGLHGAASARRDVKREGSDLTVIAYGVVLHLALEAAERAERRGHRGRGARPADARSARPGDHRSTRSRRRARC